MEADDKKEIQDHIDNACYGQKVERPLGISMGAQNGASEVVDHDGGHSRKNDLQVEGGFVQYVGGRSHQEQKRPGGQKTDEDQRQSGQKADCNGSMDIILSALMILTAQCESCSDIGSDGKTNEKIRQKVDQGSGGTHGCQRFASGKSSNNDDVGSVEKKLKAAGQHQGQTKCNDLGKYRTIAHINFIRFSRHYCPLHFRRYSLGVTPSAF